MLAVAPRPQDIDKSRDGRQRSTTCLQVGRACQVDVCCQCMPGGDIPRQLTNSVLRCLSVVLFGWSVPSRRTERATVGYRRWRDVLFARIQTNEHHVYCDNCCPTPPTINIWTCLWKKNICVLNFAVMDARAAIWLIWHSSFRRLSTRSLTTLTFNQLYSP